MRVSVLVGFVLTIILGCTAVKTTPQKKIIKGSYEVIKQEEYIVGEGKALIVGYVYDIQGKKPLYFANIHIENLKKGDATDSLGKFHFEVPSGVHQIEAYSVGNTTMITEPIKFESNTKTEIVFNLGTVIEY